MEKLKELWNRITGRNRCSDGNVKPDEPERRPDMWVILDKDGVERHVKFVLDENVYRLYDDVHGVLLHGGFHDEDECLEELKKISVIGPKPIRIYDSTCNLL